MATDLQSTDLKGRIQQLEGSVKALRWVVVFAGIFFLFQSWLLIHPALFQAGAVRARKFTVVDDKGKTLAEFGAQNGVSSLSFYDANYKSKAQIAVSEAEGPKIILWDKDQNQRALLEVSEGPHLVLHSSDHQVRAILTADDDTATFWIKDKKGFATILGNAVEETRSTNKSARQPVVTDKVKRTPGASIQLRDPANTTLWKAP